MAEDRHLKSEVEAGREAEAIVRRALAELRAVDPGCDCTVLWGVRTMLALALDERVIHEVDAFAAIDLVHFLQHAQSSRRVRFGLDECVVDGPIDPRADREGALVARVTVRLDGRYMDVAEAVNALDEEPGNDA